MAAEPLLRRRPSRLWSLEVASEQPSSLVKRQSTTGNATITTTAGSKSLLQKHTERRNSVWGAVVDKNTPDDEDALLHALQEFTEFGQDE